MSRLVLPRPDEIGEGFKRVCFVYATSGSVLTCNKLSSYPALPFLINWFFRNLGSQQALLPQRRFNYFFNTLEGPLSAKQCNHIHSSTEFTLYYPWPIKSVCPTSSAIHTFVSLKPQLNLTPDLRRPPRSRHHEAALRLFPPSFCCSWRKKP